jgi:hypothetical protein
MATEQPHLAPLWLMTRSSIVRYLVLISLTWSESASAGGFRIYDQSASPPVKVRPLRLRRTIRAPSITIRPA